MDAKEEEMKKSPPGFTELNELSSKRNGGRILFATDDWFAEAENLLSDEDPVFKPDIYTEYGKWMDGWETRRKRIPGHDWCIVKLGMPGIIRGFELDTAYFTGNYAPRFSLQAAILTREQAKSIPDRGENMLGTACTPESLKLMEELKSDSWEHLIEMTPLGAGYEKTRRNHFEIRSKKIWTHVRLNIYPDGGVARLRIFGEACTTIPATVMVDLLAIENGGLCLSYSNAHYGHPRNLIRKGRGINMGDGWETARRLDRPPILTVDPYGILQVPGKEWAIFRLGHIGMVDAIEVDTAHFKGNYPDSIRIEGINFANSLVIDWNRFIDWGTILPASKLSPDKVHVYGDKEIEEKGPFSHVKITMAPDGGISRVRIFGTVRALRHLN